MNTQQYRYCPRCRTKLQVTLKYGRERPNCPRCHFIYFEDPKVAAVVWLEHEDAILMVQRSVEPDRGKWALPAGYIDRGEDPRAAAIRETEEETGLQVEIVRLLDVYYGGPPTISIIFAARLIGGMLRAGDDAADVRWLRPGDPYPQIAFESTRRLLRQWAEAHSVPPPPEETP